MSDKYIVSARKYRPDSFRSIVGQSSVSETLKTAVISKKVAHAYLFCGPRGVGKTTAARVLAKTINCLELQSDGEACNECESCRAFEEQRSYNVFELDAASNNSVEDIRSLTEQVSMPPAFGSHKVYIIDEVHMLSKQAFNAFLKTLEEPPSYAIFILATTERHKILPTILSRCQIFDFKRIGLMDIVEHLAFVAKSEGLQAEEEALALIAEKADGGMRDALSMFDRIASFSDEGLSYQKALACLNLLDYVDYVKIIDYLLTNDYRAMLLLLDSLFARGFDGQVILQGFSNFLRDLLMAQFPNTQKLLEKPKSVQDVYVALSQRCATKALYDSLEALTNADFRYRQSANKRLLVEMTFLSLLPFFQDEAFGGGIQKSQSNQSVQESIEILPKEEKKDREDLEKSSGRNDENVGKNLSNVQTSSQVAKQEEVEASSVKHVNPSTSSSRLSSMRRKAMLLNRQVVPEKEEIKAKEVVEMNEAFNEEDVQRYWLAFKNTELNQEDRIIKSGMEKVPLPKLVDNHVVEIYVYSRDVALDQYASVYNRLKEFLQEKLCNTSIKLSLVEITPELQESIPIDPAQKEQALCKANPHLLLLKEELQLFRK